MSDLESRLKYIGAELFQLFRNPLTIAITADVCLAMIVPKGYNEPIRAEGSTIDGALENLLEQLEREFTGAGEIARARLEGVTKIRALVEPMMITVVKHEDNGS